VVADLGAGNPRVKFFELEAVLAIDEVIRQVQGEGEGHQGDQQGPPLDDPPFAG